MIGKEVAAAYFRLLSGARRATKNSGQPGASSEVRTQDNHVIDWVNLLRGDFQYCEDYSHKVYDFVSSSELRTEPEYKES
jgi:hypothetical protein